MNFGAKVAVDFGCSLAIAGAALAAGWCIARGANRRAWFWVLALAPLLTPALLVSYAWARVALALSAKPWALYGFHAVILALKLAPVAALARHFFPPPLSAEADFCHRLLGARTTRERAWFLVRAAGSLPWIVFGLLFLLAFPEFELASLWSLKTWPVALFDAHTGGLALTESLRLACAPTLVQFVILAALACAARHLHTGSVIAPSRSHPGRVAVAYTALAFGLLTLWPLALVSGQAIAGFSSLTSNTIFPQDLAADLAFAIPSALGAWLLAGHLRKHAMLAWIAMVPGLLGSLVVALLVLALFQLPGLHIFYDTPVIYDTPVPLLTALVVILLPGALLLRRFVDAPRAAEALHLARLVRSRRLVWELDTERRFAAVALLACWAWFDFTASSILAPVGLTPVFVRLHNLAHYGQAAALSAMLFAAVAAPAAVLALTLGGARLYARRDAR